ncbi:MAG: hypothetical protein U1F49_07160 [Rubrivivax sp.]
MEPAQRQQFIAIVVSEAERLSRLVNQVLDMAKIEAATPSGTPPMSISARCSSRRCKARPMLLRERGAGVELEQARARAASARRP